MNNRIVLGREDLEALLNGKAVSKPAYQLELILSDVGFLVIRQLVSEAEERRELRPVVEKLDRARVVALLELSCCWKGASIQCYDHETDVKLREALIENVIDRTIHEDLLYE